MQETWAKNFSVLWGCHQRLQGCFGRGGEQGGLGNIDHLIIIDDPPVVPIGHGLDPFVGICRLQ